MPAGHMSRAERPTREMVAPRSAVSSENTLRCEAMLALGEIASCVHEHVATVATAAAPPPRVAVRGQAWARATAPG